MNQKFLIKTIALKILEKIYLESDCYFKATINAYELETDKVSKTTIQKSGKYLKDKAFIETNEYASDNWNATITCAGIDWLEECHDINPCS